MARRGPHDENVDRTLLERLQAGAAEVQEQPDVERIATDTVGRGTHEVVVDPLRHGMQPNRRAMSPTAPERPRSNRTTLSVPTHVGQKARRMTMALTLLGRRVASLGSTLEYALDLLEQDLEEAGADIPDDSVALRSGLRRR